MLFSFFNVAWMKAATNVSSSHQSKEETPNIVELYTHSGNVFYYALASKPVLKYISTEIVIVTNEGSVSFNKKDVKEVNFAYMDEIPSSIDDITSAGVIKYENQVLSVSNYKPKTVVSVFGIDGILQKREIVGKDGTISINMSTLPSAIYVIKVGDDSLKIKK